MGQINKMTTFGKFIKTEREKRKWTQTEFGAKIGINASAISRIESGSQNFSKSKLKELSELFKIQSQQVTDLFFADKFAKEAFLLQKKLQIITTILILNKENLNYE